MLLIKNAEYGKNFLTSAHLAKQIAASPEKMP